MKKIVLIVLSLFVAVSAFAENEGTKKIRDCINVFDRFMAIPEESIPETLLRDAKAIAIIPNLIKVGFIIGGRHGSGVLAVRRKDGSWSNPLFITLTGGSLGWQIGAQSVDIILVFKTNRSVEDILEGKVTLGADASVAAGPVGRSAEAATDIKLKSEIYAYSRSRGAFIGVSLEGAVLKVDIDANTQFYKKPGIRPRDILYANIKVPDPIVNHFKRKLSEYTK
ncbi:lipid-binding SYLF domain-containing protein [Nitrosophilus alvini]|uniref:lipid-binding SYLF domain-containing protein n=1 Tax=Nitrosophilus alvini TaxID=2714855 RepID=UPI0019098A26|nr:lipid-binding SYLF domain-containing protein [Nitrosophilus alvini]